MINIEALIVIALFAAIVIWGLLKTRKIGESKPPTLLILQGNAHAGKTQVFYSLVSQAPPMATVRTVEGSVYTGTLETIPGVSFKVYDMPTDTRARPNLPEKHGGIIVVFLQRGDDCSCLIDAYLSELKNKKLLLFLIIPIEIAVNDLKTALYSGLTTQTGTTMHDEALPPTVLIADMVDFAPLQIRDIILNHTLTKVS